MQIAMSYIAIFNLTGINCLLEKIIAMMIVWINPNTYMSWENTPKFWWKECYRFSTKLLVLEIY